jgi:cytochrome bd-type quinol oxidase subunit 2
MAIASLVCSLFGWLCVVGPLFGLIFGFVALNQIKEKGQRGRGLALAGIVIGGILVVLVIGMQLHRTQGGHIPHKNTGAPAVVMIVEPQAV